MGLEPAVAFIGASSESPIGKAQMTQSNPREPCFLAEEFLVLSCLGSSLQLFSTTGPQFLRTRSKTVIEVYM